MNGSDLILEFDDALGQRWGCTMNCSSRGEKPCPDCIELPRRASPSFPPEVERERLVEMEWLATLREGDVIDADACRHLDAILAALPRMGMEAAARVIDPAAFLTVREIAAAQGLDASNPPAGVVIMDDIDTPLANREADRQSALTKAATILGGKP